MKFVFLLCLFIMTQPLAANEELQEADRYFQATLFDKALPLYARLAAQNLTPQEQHYVLIRLAQSYAAQKEYAKAVTVLQGVDDPVVLELTTQIYLEQKDYSNALSVMDRYLKLQGSRPQSETMQLRAAEALIFLGDFAKATTYLNQISSAAASYAQAQIYLIQIDLKQAAYQSALDRLLTMKEAPEWSRQLLFLTGEAYFGLNNFQEAAKSFKKFLDTASLKNDRNVIPAVERLLFAYLNMDDYTQAERLLSQYENELPGGDFFYIKGRYFTEKGIRVKDQESSRLSYQAASTAFLRSYDELKGNAVATAERSLMAASQVDARTKDPICCSRALRHLKMLKGDPTVEQVYLQGVLSAYLVDAGKLPAEEVIQNLQEAISQHPQEPIASNLKLLLGGIYYNQHRYQEALNSFLTVAETNELPGDAYFWAAKSLESIDPSSQQIKEYKKIIFEAHPDSSYADEAYFSYYSYRDYLQGDRAAIKHLQSLMELFPQSRYTINAHYLIGMDFKRDRKSPEGKSLRKKDLNSSIEAFQDTETTFDQLYSAGKLPQDQIPYFAKIRYRAILERALANLAIGDESQGAKKKIFYEYAVENLKRTVDELSDPKHPYAPLLTRGEAYPQLLEESSFWLAQGYIRLGDDVKADRLLEQMIKRYGEAKVTRGYFLSRVWYERALVAMRQKQYNRAIEDFNLAEDTGKGKVLSTDQKIDLWIQQSLTYKEMGDTEKAMLTLSKAINDDAISSLRVKAMYLRAEIYEIQGRHELARRQLEATSKKGGEWALKARQKMDKEYGIR